ncbi:MAG: hypothetical protein K2M95_04745, partial [Clostridiales bacterium]|nr:hypothetical protein [Clostridiales bacterium]
MAISNEVIELETKKKGRNVLFIVLIAVLAAAAAAFAVLWILKAPAVDPPKVEKIQIAATTMALKSEGETQEERVYSVAPGGKYTIYFDAVLKENSNADNTNSLLTVECISHYGDFVYINGETGLVRDPEHPTRYALTFTVAATAPTNAEFSFRITSSFSPDTDTTVKVTVEESYAEVFDLKGDDDGNKTLEGSGNRLYSLEHIEDKSSENVIYYRANGLTYYEEGLETKRENFTLRFEQFGKLGLDNRRQRVSGRQLSDGTYFDQVEVWVADKIGVEADDASFKLLKDSNETQKSSFLDFYLQYGQGYCHENLMFTPAKAGASTVKLIANAKNGGTPLVILIELTFVSSKAQDRITEIIFTNPYTGKVSDSVDLYIGNINNDNRFHFAPCIKVVRNGKEEAGEWGSAKLRLYESTASGLTNGAKDFLSDNRMSGSDAVGLNSSVNMGATYITIEDGDPNGFGVRKTVQVNVHPQINPQDFKARVTHRDGVAVTTEESDDIEETVFSNGTLDLRLSYKLKDSASVGSVASATIRQNLNSAPNIEYEGNIEKPNIKSSEVASNAAKTITFVGMSKAASGAYVLTPELTGESSFTANVQLKVGNELVSGTYTVYLVLPAQGLQYDAKTNTYTAIDGKTISITLDVVRDADVVRVKDMEELTAEGGAFKDDEYTLLLPDENDDTKATLTIALGTGQPDADGKSYTSFTLADILDYYYGANAQTKTEEARTQNYAALAITLNSQFPGEVWDEKTGRFVVLGEDKLGQNPYVFTIRTKHGKGATFALTVRYRMPVKYLSIVNDNGAARTFYYSDKVEETTEGVLMVNEPVRLHSAKNNVLNITENNAASTVNFPNNMHIELSVLRDGTSYILPKKTIGNYVYYFALDTNEADRVAANAYFRTDTTSFWSNGGKVRLLKDIFAIDYVNRDTAFTMYQNIRVYYYYGETAEKALRLEEGAYGYMKVMVAEGDPYVVTANYELCRRLNGIVEFTDASYSKKADKNASDSQDKGASGTHSSGVAFSIYASGIITYGAGGANEFVVRRDNIGRKFRTDTLQTPVIVCAGNGAGNESVGYTLEYDEVRELFTARCTAGTEQPSCGIITYNAGELNSDCAPLSISIGVSNKAVPISNIEFFLDSDRTTPYTLQQVYANANAAKRDLTVYYRISYDQYDEQAYLALDAFWFDYDHDAFTLTTAMPPFTAPKECIKPDGTKLQNGERFIYNGELTLKLKAGVLNGAYDITCIAPNNTSANQTIKVDVTTLIDQASFRAGNSNTDIQVGCMGNSTSLTVDYLPTVDTSVKSPNVYDFAFGFVNDDGTTIDARNLSYRITVPTGVTGAFYDATNASMKNGDTFLASITGDRAKQVVGFRLRMDGATVSAQPVSVIVTEENPETHVESEYEFKLTLTVDVPITELSMKIGSAERNHGHDYNVTTDGLSDWEELELTPVYNDSVATKQPLSAPAVKFELRSEGEEHRHFGDVYELRYKDGKTYLAINRSAITAPIVLLDLTVSGKIFEGGEIKSADMTITVKLFWWGTTKLSMAFDNKDFTFAPSTPTEGEYTQEDNEPIDFKVTVGNAATGEVKTGITPTYTVVSQSGVTVAQSGSVFTPSGASGTYVIKAEYVNPDDANDVLTLTVTVTVQVKVTQVLLRQNGKAVVNLYLVAGQTQNCTVDVLLYGLNNTTPADTSFTITSENPEYCRGNDNVDTANGTFLLTPVAAGVTVITVTAASGVTATLTVTVYAPTVVVTSTQGSYDVFTDADPSFTVALRDAGGYTEADLTDVTLTLSDGTVFASAVYNAATFKYEFAYANKAALTDADMKSYTLTLTAKLNGVPLYVMGTTSATCIFALEKSGYTPMLVLKYQGNPVNELNLAYAEGDYTFSINNGSVSLGAFGTAAVLYSVQTPNTFTVANNGAVTFAANAQVGSATVTATVTLAGGLTFTTSPVTYTIADSSTISSDLYISDTNPLSALSTATSLDVFGTSIKGVMGVDVGYEDANDRKFVSLLIDYTSAPAAVVGIGSSDVDKFVVIGVTDVLEFVAARLFTLDNHKY